MDVSRFSLARKRILCCATAALALPSVGALQAAISFNNISELSGVDQIRTETWGASWEDLDGDGRPDMFVNNHRNIASLLRNNGDRTFTDVSLEVDALKGWVFTSQDTHGAAWGDYDNDGDQDLTMPHQWFFENVDGRLLNRTSTIGVYSTQQFASANAWFDHDLDGRLDFKARFRGTGSMSEQQSNGLFSRVIDTGVNCGAPGFPTAGHFMQMANLDDSGRMEVLCGLYNGSYPDQGSVYSLNSGAATTVPFPVDRPVRDVAIADFDGDGDVDLFYVKGALRISDFVQVDANRIEAFMNVTNDNVKTFQFSGTGVVEVDIDWNEGDEGGQRNRTGRPQDRMRIGAAGIAPAETAFTVDSNDPSTHGLVAFDPATDKILAIGYDPATSTWTVALPGAFANEVAHFAFESVNPITAVEMTGTSVNDRAIDPRLLLNDGTGNFADSPAVTGLQPELCASVGAGDFDNDMDVDIYLVCRGGSQNLANVLYENNGDGTFIRRGSAGGAVGPVGVAVGRTRTGAGTGESVAVADFDVDGYLDLFVTNGMNLRPRNYGGPHQLFRNTGAGSGNHWVQFDFAAQTNNRDGIGATVYVTTPDGKRQRRERNGGYHRWSQDHKRLHLGLAGNTSFDVEVRWPNGSVDTFGNLPADTVYVLSDVGEPVALELGSPTPFKCSQPDYTPADDRGFFLWQNCFNGVWSIRGAGGGTDTRYEGRIVGSGIGLTATSSLEAGDIVEQQGQDIVFDLQSAPRAQDGFSFTVPDPTLSNTPVCLEVRATPPAPVLVGAEARQTLQRVDLRTMQACADGSTADADADGVADGVDNCAFVANAAQTNSDGFLDGGDACDLDDDNDSLSDVQEALAGTNPLNPDTDGDGLRDDLDPLPLDSTNGGAGPTLNACDAPVVDSSADSGTFIWASCDGSDRWQLLVSGGGTSRLLVFAGAVEQPGGVQATPIGLEAADTLALNGDRLAFELRVFGSGVDAFEFVATADACIALPADQPIYLGADRSLITTSTLDLATLEACAGDPDTDGDGLSDAFELSIGTDPLNADTDGERLNDGLEVLTYGTDPLSRNTDRDGLSDFAEVAFKGTDPLDADTDDDGLSDGAEAAASGLGTNPLVADTDGGGVNDGAEVQAGTDPFDPTDD